MLYNILGRKLVQVTVLFLHMDSFALITQRKSLEDDTGPLSGLEGVDPELCGKIDGQDGAYR